jgi:hypothetical protein
MAVKLRLVFRIFYSTFFTILNIALLGLLFITPGDTIQQALANNQLYNVFIIAGCYFLTMLLAIVIYASRLYTTRSALAAIPKTWIPVEKGDVGKAVRKMIVESLTRSALVAWDARPRVSNAANGAELNREPATRETTYDPSPKETRTRIRKLIRRRPKKQNTLANISIPPHEPVWGTITHDGWASPYSPDLADLQYTTVILELPHLIEAKAVSLAPPDPDSTTTPPMPDPRAVELLQRPATIGLRAYISHLSRLGLLTTDAPVTEFISAYENARFSTKPLSEPEFRNLMKDFAEILRSMVSLDPILIEEPQDGGSEIDGDAPSSSTPATPRSQSPESSRSGWSGSEGTVRTAPSRRQPGLSAPATPRSRQDRLVTRTPSADSFAQTRRPYAISQLSSGSLRSASASGTGSGSDAGSVIRLSPSHAPGDLPYTLQIPASMN